MNTPVRTGMLATLMLASGALAACGPTLVNFDPSNAVSLDVRPTTGQKVFCPGVAFQVEILAKLQSGSTCSSSDRSIGCQGQKDAVISPKMIRLEGDQGKRLGELEKFVWEPPADIFVTADTGVTLRAWLEKTVEGQYQKSVIGESELVPVYACHMGDVFSSGTVGGTGPEVRVAITSLKTPFYPDAALVRVDGVGSRSYYISPSAEEAIHIVSHGGNGASGQQGQTGKRGEDGRAAPSGAAVCTRGENGRDGQDGGNGAPGGDGGPGGVIRITVDKAAADALKGRILAESVGGGAGPGGRGGDGGPGGRGGDGITAPNCGSSDTKGQDGRAGRAGQPGPDGRPGPAGPAPVITTGTRQSLFADEMSIIERIESAKRKTAK